MQIHSQQTRVLYDKIKWDIITDATHRDWWSLVLATASAVLTEGVCAAAVLCVVGGVCFRRLSGEHSICLLSEPVGVLAPDLQAITKSHQKPHRETLKALLS